VSHNFARRKYARCAERTNGGKGLPELILRHSFLILPPQTIRVMPSFDIANKIDLQTLDNVVNIAKKEIDNRYDFKGTHVSFELNKKDFTIAIEVESEMKLQQLEDVLLSKAVKQNMDPRSFDLSKEPAGSGKYVRKTVTIRNGIDKEYAKKIVKMIKDSGLKVQAAIMDDIIRVTGKNRDDLQGVVSLCRTSGLEIPLQFVNMKD
jgi:cyclic-di-GMP-binding protein